jgi:hypothetical protein
MPKGVLAVVLGGCILGAGPIAGAQRMPDRSGRLRTCRLAGHWLQWTHGVGSSEWSVAAGGAARERGLGNASGRARFLGPRLIRLDWNIPVGVGGVRWSGVYRWRLADCDNGRGWLTFTRGPHAREVHASSLVRTDQGAALSDKRPVSIAHRRGVQARWTARSRIDPMPICLAISGVDPHGACRMNRCAHPRGSRAPAGR